MDATINEGEKFKEDLEMTSTAGDCNGARLDNQTKGYAVTGRVWINVCVFIVLHDNSSYNIHQNVDIYHEGYNCC